jgi:hypothetical protein
VIGVGVYQILCHRLGFQFPAWLFNSNEAWAENFDQHVGGVSRVSATFVEPSSAAAFMASWCMFELMLAIWDPVRSRFHWTCVVLGSVILVETASSTGYIAGALIWIMITSDFVKSLLVYGRIRVRVFAAVFTMGAVVLLTLATMPNVQLLLNQLLFQKNISSSGLHRSVTFGRAVTVFYESLGLGVGLGSNRAMSLFFYLLSNVGLPGMLLFFYLLSKSYGQVSLRIYSSSGPNQIFLKAVAYGLGVYIITMVLSGAEITTPYLWILWGMLFAGIRESWLAEKQLSSDNIYAGAQTLIEASHRVPHLGFSA